MDDSCPYIDLVKFQRASDIYISNVKSIYVFFWILFFRRIPAHLLLYQIKYHQFNRIKLCQTSACLKEIPHFLVSIA